MVDHQASKGAIQEKVEALQEHKPAIFNRAVDDGGRLAARLTIDEIRRMLRGLRVPRLLTGTPMRRRFLPHRAR